MSRYIERESQDCVKVPCGLTSIQIADVPATGMYRDCLPHTRTLFRGQEALIHMKAHEKNGESNYRRLAYNRSYKVHHCRLLPLNRPHHAIKVGDGFVPSRWQH